MSATLFSQVEWGEIGTKFKYNRERENGSEIEYSILTIAVDRDTMIDDKICQILKEENNTYGWNWSCDGAESIIYEEEGRVYYLYPESLDFGLLYDFNKIQGEEWQVEFFCSGIELDGSYFTVRVDSTGLEMIDGVELETQYVSLIDSTGWWFSSTRIYENIGSVDHFFYEEEWFWTTLHDWIRGLRCYESSDGTLLRFESVIDCDQLTTTSLEKEVELLVYPNPTVEELNIQLSGLFSYRLLSITGRELLRMRDNTDRAVISLNDLNAGLYVIEIETHGNLFYRKVIKR